MNLSSEFMRFDSFFGRVLVVREQFMLELVTSSHKGKLTFIFFHHMCLRSAESNYSFFSFEFNILSDENLIVLLEFSLNVCDSFLFLFSDICNHFSEHWFLCFTKFDVNLWLGFFLTIFFG
jgi:hypothetical protein